MLFVHGSSMGSQPTFDLHVPGRPDSSVMDWFAARGFDTWCMDNEGYGRSDKHRPINSDIANGADDLDAGTRYIIETARCEAAPDLRHLLGRTEGGALRAAPSGTGRAACPRRVRVDRRGQPDARRPAEEACPSTPRRPAGRSTARSCTASSTATTRAPPTRPPSTPSPTRSSRSTTRCRPARTSTCARSCRSSIRRRFRCRRS